MSYNVAEISKVENAWRIRLGDGESADMDIFVKNICVETNEGDEKLEDILCI